MNITLIIGSLANGGAERVVANLASYLVNKNHDVTILTVSSAKTYYIDKRVNHVILYDEKNSILPKFIINLIRIYRLNKYFRKKKYDVIITFLPKLSKYVLKQKRYIKSPIILTERADPFSFINSSKNNRAILSKYYPLADAYIFQTEGARDFYDHFGINVKNSIVIPNAINMEFDIPTFNGVRRKAIVSVGRLTEQKNFSLLLRAFAKISDSFPDYSLEIYGEGHLKDVLKEEAITMGIQNKVVFKGYVNNISDCIIDASLFVLPSNFEGMPNSLMEAMALGLPVISTDCSPGGPRFLIQDGVNGFLVPVNDEVIMANRIKAMLGDKNKSQLLGDEAKKIIDKLNHNKIYSQWEKFIIEVCRENRG